ncbi:cytochrome b-c1 complex subunit 2, mitochondrial isoform X1 [Bombyx mori]|uniref:Peptidase M16 N-terminal domain-containing protein n=1 Tax=Bombyx mori TaxID=7091 RepID=A0A8R2ALB6_BOMMO|nr:cytochrome b-c1 complex subunit 2, mitochondrial isoform X1 [Bombyx mori]
MKRLFRITNQNRYVSTSRSSKGACWPRPDYGPMEVQRSVMMNGIKVAAAKPLGSQIAACTIMYQAGSRYEIDDQLGASHFIRAASSATGCGYTSFAKMRYLQQNGGSITCSSDRQNISFTLRCPPTVFSELKNYLLDVASRCCYHPWEIKDRKTLIREDLVRIHPEQRVIDLVQKACWTGQLSNSVFCEEGRIDEMTDNSLNCFARTHFKSSHCTVGSVGVPFEETLKLAEKIEYKREMPEQRQEKQSCPRGGFELFDLGRDSDTWIALAVPGCGTCDVPCLFKHAIIAAACGTGNMQAGQHGTDRTPQPPLGLMAGDDIFTEYKTFNLSYCETGIFGIVAKTRAATARKAAVSAAEFLAHVGDLNFKQIDVGKQRLKVSLALHDEDCVKVSEGLALQLANNVQIDSAKNSMSVIDMLCPDEISCTAKMISSKCSQMAMAVVGDVDAVPHDAELGVK